MSNEVLIGVAAAAVVAVVVIIALVVGKKKPPAQPQQPPNQTGGRNAPATREIALPPNPQMPRPMPNASGSYPAAGRAAGYTLAVPPAPDDDEPPPRVLSLSKHRALAAAAANGSVAGESAEQPAHRPETPKPEARKPQAIAPANRSAEMPAPARHAPAAQPVARAPGAAPALPRSRPPAADPSPAVVRTAPAPAATHKPPASTTKPPSVRPPSKSSEGEEEPRPGVVNLLGADGQLMITPDDVGGSGEIGYFQDEPVTAPVRRTQPSHAAVSRSTDNFMQLEESVPDGGLEDIPIQNVERPREED